MSDKLKPTKLTLLCDERSFWTDEVLIAQRSCFEVLQVQEYRFLNKLLAIERREQVVAEIEQLKAYENLSEIQRRKRVSQKTRKEATDRVAATLEKVELSTALIHALEVLLSRYRP